MADTSPYDISRRYADANAWQEELQTFVHGHLERTQKAAQSWLTTLTALLSLFGAVVVLNGGAAINSIRGGPGWRVAAWIIAAAVFAVALAAILEGLRATFGGLTGGGTGKTSQTGLRLQENWSPPPLNLEDITWEKYQDWYLKRPDAVRKRLNRSRILGILAAAMAGILALLIAGNAAFIKTPTSVLVVDHGHIRCGPINVGADDLISIHGQVITGATQVIVGSCSGT